MESRRTANETESRRATPNLWKILGASSGSRGEIEVVQLTARAHIVEEWLRLPESRRRHATDAVAFAYRLLRDEPELLDGGEEPQTCHEVVVNWLLPYLNKRC